MVLQRGSRFIETRRVKLHIKFLYYYARRVDISGIIMKKILKIIGVLITVAIVAFFSLKNIATRPSVLMSTLKNVGAFAVLAAIAYFGFANGVETEMKDGEVLSEGGSKLVGAGLYLFYFLLIAAVGLMLYTGIKKTIK